MKLSVCKMIIAGLLTLGVVGSAKAQCTLTGTEAANLTHQMISPVMPKADKLVSSVLLHGSGNRVGWPATQSSEGYNLYSTPAPGDFTFVATLSSMASQDGTATPAAGVVVRDNGGNYVLFNVIKLGSTGYTMQVFSAHQPGISGNWPDNNVDFIIYGANFTMGTWIRISRTGTTYTVSTSPDGLNWTVIAAPFGNSYISNANSKVGVFATGTTTAGFYTTAGYDNISLNGSVPTLVDSDFGFISTGHTAGSVRPNLTYTFQGNSGAESVSYVTSGFCTQVQQNIIAMYKSSIDRYISVTTSIIDNSTGQIVGYRTNSSQAVCGACPISSVQVSLPYSEIWASNPSNYTVTTSLGMLFQDSTSYNVMATFNYYRINFAFHAIIPIHLEFRGAFTKLITTGSLSNCTVSVLDGQTTCDVGTQNWCLPGTVLMNISSVRTVTVPVLPPPFYGPFWAAYGVGIRFFPTQDYIFSSLSVGAAALPAPQSLGFCTIK